MQVHTVHNAKYCVITVVNSLVFVDLFQGRLEMAKVLGADHVIKIERGVSPQDVAKEVQALLGDMPDRTIECTGAESAIQTGIYVSIFLTVLRAKKQVPDVALTRHIVLCIIRGRIAEPFILQTIIQRGP